MSQRTSGREKGMLSPRWTVTGGCSETREPDPLLLTEAMPPCTPRGICFLNEGLSVSPAGLGEPSCFLTTKPPPLLGDGYLQSPLILKCTLKGKGYCRLVSLVRRQEAQRREVTGPRSHSQAPGPNLSEAPAASPHSLPLPYPQQGLNERC